MITSIPGRMPDDAPVLARVTTGQAVIRSVGRREAIIIVDKKRSDADRRARQCERLSRVLRVLQIIQGNGQCTAESIAQELECSERTVYRDLQTLSMAGVPYYFDEECQSYRVRSGFRRIQIDLGKTGNDSDALINLIDRSLTSAQNTLTELEQLIAVLKQVRSDVADSQK